MIEDQENDNLVAEVTKEEFKFVLLSCKTAKSLGPDRWIVEFHLGFYDFLVEELLKLIEEFRALGKVLGALNSTFRTLILKKNNLESFDDYRPISLCNSMYKIIAKILTNRLKRILSDVISEEQFGFLHNRQIHNTVGTTQER